MRARKIETYFVFKKAGHWSTNHTSANRMIALHKMKKFHNIMTTFAYDDGADMNNEALTQELEDIATHIVSHGTESCSSAGTFSATIYLILENFGSIRFILTFHNSATYHQLSSNIKKPEK